MPSCNRPTVVTASHVWTGPPPTRDGSKAGLFSGDLMITPAISVPSAVEGLKVINPALQRWIVPITAVIIVALFAVQRRGTGAVGGLFGAVMIGWFVAIRGMRCERHH